MTEAVDYTKLYPVFQPIIGLTTRGIMGYEVLVRHESKLSPGDLFGQARRNGELFDLDLHAIFLSIVGVPSHFNQLLFVNVYPSTILHKDFWTFFTKISSVVSRANFKVVFEINEQEPKLLKKCLFKRRIKKIRNEGFYIAMDDIGTIQMECGNVFKFDPDFIKIDGAFSYNLAKNPFKQQFIKELQGSNGGRATLILEGLESEEDAAAALGLGLEFGQGYIFGKPERKMLEITNIAKEGNRSEISSF